MIRASGPAPTPLTVLGGFLGAGKTTLANALLRQAAGLRLAVLVNDFGAVNIDAALIAGIAGDVVALTNGCICCAVGDDFAAGLAAVLGRRPAPDHILIETSGVADPAPLAEIAQLDPELRLAGVVVLADAAGVAGRLADARLADTLRRQLRAADLLVLTKTDLAPAAPAAALLRPLAPRAAVTEAIRGALPIAVALGEHAAGPRAATLPEPARHGALFASVVLRQRGPVPAVALRAALDALPEGGVLRAKGVLALDGGAPMLVQRVGRRLEIAPWPCALPAEAALVLIGTEAVWDAAEALRPLGLLRV